MSNQTLLLLRMNHGRTIWQVYYLGHKSQPVFKKKKSITYNAQLDVSQGSKRKHMHKPFRAHK